MRFEQTKDVLDHARSFRMVPALQLRELIASSGTDTPDGEAIYVRLVFARKSKINAEVAMPSNICTVRNRKA